VFNQRLQRVLDTCLLNLDESLGVEAWMQAFMHAYDRIHAMVMKLIADGRELGDSDLGKLLQVCVVCLCVCVCVCVCAWMGDFVCRVRMCVSVCV
jgi:hypothetical protein